MPALCLLVLGFAGCGEPLSEDDTEEVQRGVGLGCCPVAWGAGCRQARQLLNAEASRVAAAQVAFRASHLRVNNVLASKMASAETQTRARKEAELHEAS